MKKAKRITVFLLSIFAAASVFTVSVSADIGPKPSVVVSFENGSGDACYGTLLSERAHYGPYTVYDGTEETYNYYGDDDEIWRKFVDFRDADGYYFLQIIWDVGDTGTIRWGYYPPERFKILLYYPESGTFAESGVCERYAFDSYFTVDLSAAATGKLAVGRSYDYTNELLSLAVRIVMTVAVELGIAFLFGFRAKKELLVILVTNAVTQIGLNVALNVYAHYYGSLSAMIWYVMLEIIVLAVEAAVYCTILRKASEKPRRVWIYPVYALAANAVSFAAGWWIAYLMPSVF
ncbi:MAG: hypothetical protein J5940_03810 [Clostridia bacterium]|nr:hypothetical protein [Clostridia bacterium]